MYHTLLNLSSGIDSLWCLWDYARRKEPLLIHYCQLTNWTGRGEYEARAIDRILAWIDTHMPFDYKLIRTGFDYGNARIVQDKEVIGFITGIILRDTKHPLQSIIISSNKEDISRTGYYVRTEADRLRLIEGVGRRRLEYLYPIAGKTKAQLIAELPPELVQLSWFCRVPAKGGVPCGSCKTCKAVLPVFEQRGIAYPLRAQ